MLLRETLDFGLAFRLIFLLIYRLIRWIILGESAIFAWLAEKAKPVEILHIVGRFRPKVSEIASVHDFLVFHEAFTTTQELFSSKEWHLYGFDGSSAWFVRCASKIEKRKSQSRSLFESASKVARLSIRDFLREAGEIPDNPVAISTLTSLSSHGLHSVLSCLNLDGVAVENDPPYLSSLSFAINKCSGRNRRQLLDASLRFTLRFAAEERALVIIRSSLIDTVPLFSRIELPCVSFILHPPSAREAIERLLEEERDYLLVITRLLPYIPAWLLPHLAPALAVFGDNFLRIDPGRADEAALAVYCRFLQESTRLSLSAHSLFESSLQTRIGDFVEPEPGSREPSPISRSRLRALKRLAFGSIEEDLLWEEESPAANAGLAEPGSAGFLEPANVGLPLSDPRAHSPARAGERAGEIERPRTNPIAV